MPPAKPLVFPSSPIGEHPYATPEEVPDVADLEVATLYEGFLQLKQVRFRHRLHLGGLSTPITREIVDCFHYAAILPYDPVADTILLIEQFRIGAYCGHLPAWQQEIVAGIIDPGETADAVACREAKEEAGCDILDLIPISRYAISPGMSSETMTLFCGRIDSRGLGGFHGLAAEQEDIRAYLLPYRKVRRLLKGGGITNAVTLIALQWLILNRPWLRPQWQPHTDTD